MQHKNYVLSSPVSYHLCMKLFFSSLSKYFDICNALLLSEVINNSTTILALSIFPTALIVGIIVNANFDTVSLLIAKIL